MKRINRIVVAVSDIEEAAGRYEAIFAVPFTRTGPHIESMGVKVAAAWNIGVELIQPISGSASQFSQDISKHLSERGEGLYGVVFETIDMEGDVEQMKRSNVTAYGPTFSLPRPVLDAEFGGAFSRFAETIFTPDKLGYLVAVMDAALLRQPAQDPQRQDHAAPAALHRQGRGDHAGHLDAGESGDRGAAAGKGLTAEAIPEAGLS